MNRTNDPSLFDRLPSAAISSLGSTVNVRLMSPDCWPSGTVQTTSTLISSRLDRLGISVDDVEPSGASTSKVVAGEFKSPLLRTGTLKVSWSSGIALKPMLLSSVTVLLPLVLSTVTPSEREIRSIA